MQTTTYVITSSMHILHATYILMIHLADITSSVKIKNTIQNIAFPLTLCMTHTVLLKCNIVLTQVNHL